MTDDDLEADLRRALHDIADAAIGEPEPGREQRLGLASSPAPQGGERRPRGRWLSAAAIALVVAGLIGAGLIWGSDRGEREPDRVAAGEPEIAAEAALPDPDSRAEREAAWLQEFGPAAAPDVVLPGQYVFESGLVDGAPVAASDTLLRVIDGRIDIEDGPDLTLDGPGKLNPSCGTMFAGLDEDGRQVSSAWATAARGCAASVGERPELVAVEVIERVDEIVVLDTQRVALRGNGVDLRFVRSLASWPAGRFILVSAAVDGVRIDTEGAVIAAGRLVADTAGYEAPLYAATSDRGCQAYGMTLPRALIMTPQPLITPFSVGGGGIDLAGSPRDGCAAFVDGELDAEVASRLASLDRAAMPTPDVLGLFGPGIELTFRRQIPAPGSEIAIVTGNGIGGIDVTMAELRFDDALGCLYLELGAGGDTGETRVVPQWPPGYTAGGDPVVMRNDVGIGVAEPGDILQLVGSSSDTSRLDGDLRCGATGPGSLFVVSADPLVAVAGDAPAPSQSAADARRDGVAAERAAVSLRDRLFAHLAVEASEGTWVLGRAVDGYGDGEIVLVDSAGAVLRAYPMPGAPPNWIHLTDDTVYAGRVGDGALPDSTLIRIDRSSGEATIVVLPAPFDGSTSWLPGWLVAEEGPAVFERLVKVGPSRGRGVLVLNSIGQVRVDIAGVDAFIDEVIARGDGS